jgi:hypothetical protein
VIAARTTDATYQLITNAVITTRADSLIRVDTAQSVTALRVTPRGSAYDIVLDSHVVRVGPTPAVRLPVGARAVARLTASGMFEFIGAGLEPCVGPARSAFESTRELWVRWPDSVRADTRWSDSSTTIICRDGIPLSLTTVRQYRLEEPSTDSLLVIRRDGRVQVRGQGSLRGDTTTIVGDGTSDALLFIRPHTGWIDSARVGGMLRLEVRGSVRTQRVEQRTAGLMRRAPNIP